jgi:colanic acid/amylovoran biosynthesis glycosyltransferase
MQELSGPHALKGGVLVVAPSAVAARKGELLFLDDKAVSGLKLYSQFWSGPVRCVLRKAPASATLYGSWHNPDTLPFEVVLIPATGFVPDSALDDAAVVLASGDNYLNFPLAKQCRALGLPLVYSIEYILETRLEIIALSDAPLLKRLKSMVWTLKAEFARRAALRLADAVQANGVPAARNYAGVNSKIITYFDTRVSEDMLASSAEIDAKAARRASGAPLRLSFSGRLERMKGADHLQPLAERLVARAVDFELHVFGAGSMAQQLSEAATRKDLANRLVFHGPVKFDSELVPWMRTNCDIFVCCHRQSDPSCTYTETLGCGVPIVGYRNRAFEGIVDATNAGWAVRKNDLDALADQIVRLNRRRDEITTKSRAAIAFAHENTFEKTFFNRIAQLRPMLPAASSEPTLASQYGVQTGL